jgi:hypothetical protein
VTPDERDQGRDVHIRGLRAPAKRVDALLLVSSVAAAFTPKCPLCVFALLGATGAVGAAAAAWMPAVMVASLLLSVAAVCLRARVEQRYAPAGGAVIAAIAMLAGKFVFRSTTLVLTGAAALFCVAVANFAIERIRWHKPLAP